MSNQRKKISLYEYAILLHPMAEDANKPAPPSEILVERTTVLAASEQEALIQASRAIPDPYLSRLQEVEIAVRPF